MTREEILAERQLVCKVADNWVMAKTPYKPHQRVKGEHGGTDCAMLLACVFEEAGVLPRVNPGHYSIQIHLHQGDSQYLDLVSQHGVEITEAEVQPGDIVLFAVARAYAHGGIIIDWPRIVHAKNRIGVIYDNVHSDPFVKRRPKKFFTLKRWK